MNADNSVSADQPGVYEAAEMAALLDKITVRWTVPVSDETRAFVEDSMLLDRIIEAYISTDDANPLVEAVDTAIEARARRA